jgi:glycosyltransferase involved in cell wall biosynthesis
MKKITFIITDYGSFNNFLGDLSVKLSHNSFDITVFTSKEKVIDIEDKYDYLKLGVKFKYVNFPRNFNFFSHYKISKKIQAELSKIKPDLVSIHFTTAIFSSLISGKIPFKTIGTFHGLGYPVIETYFKRNIFKFVELFSCNKLDEVWLLNKMDFNILAKKFNKKVFLLPTKGLGCDLNIFDLDRYDNNLTLNIKDSLGFNNNNFILSFTGRYVSFKGFDLVVRAFRILEEEFCLKDIKLITMGGKDKIHPTGLSLEEEHYFLRSENIKNIGFTQNVSDYLAISNLFVFPSKKEGVPVCIIEALAMNVPVISLDVRGCNDLLRNGENGFLFHVDASPMDIAEKIYDLIKNKNVLFALKDKIKKERFELSRERFLEHQLGYFANLD